MTEVGKGMVRMMVNELKRKRCLEDADYKEIMEFLAPQKKIKSFPMSVTGSIPAPVA